MPYITETSLAEDRFRDEILKPVPLANRRSVQVMPSDDEILDLITSKKLGIGIYIFIYGKNKHYKKIEVWMVGLNPQFSTIAEKLV